MASCPCRWELAGPQRHSPERGRKCEASWPSRGGGGTPPRQPPRRRRYTFLLRFRHKAVAYATHGLQVFGLRRVLFDIAAQTHHKIIDRAGVGIFVQSPDFFEDRFAGYHFSVVADQVAQKLGFHQREMDGISKRAQFEFAEVDCFSVEAKNVGPALGPGTSRIFTRRAPLGSLLHPGTAAQKTLEAGDQD